MPPLLLLILMAEMPSGSTAPKKRSSLVSPLNEPLARLTVTTPSETPVWSNASGRRRRGVLLLGAHRL
jgi:hypothetical protein